VPLMMHNQNNEEHLIVPRKTVIHAVALCILLAFFFFLAGYFLGKKRALHDFLAQQPQDLFGQEVTYAFARMQKTTLVQSSPVIITEQQETSIINTTTKKILPQKNLTYKAELIGFGTLHGAQEFVNRLQRNGINTTIVKHTAQVPTSSDKMRSVSWYQVVTESYDAKNKLEVLVEGIKKIVKLHDIRIVKVDNGCTS